MRFMTEEQARAEGLSIIPADGVPVREEPADTADRNARFADELAAVVEGMCRAGKVSYAGMAMVRNGLGALHVELDELAEELRRGERARYGAVGVA